MTTTIIKQKFDAKWLRIEPASKAKGQECGAKKIAWVELSKASSFANRDSAAKAYESALADMKAFAQAKADKFNAAGGKPMTFKQASEIRRQNEWSDFASKMSNEAKAKALVGAQIPPWADAAYTIEQKFSSFGAIPLGVASGRFLPKWAQLDLPIEYETIASADDMLSSMNIFYVRAGNFWASGSFSLVQELHQAKPFFSKEAAQDHARQFSHYPSLSIVQASMIFTAVDFVPGKQRTDPISNLLHSACESRDISSAIDVLAAQRIAANPPPPAGAAKRRL